MLNLSKKNILLTSAIALVVLNGFGQVKKHHVIKKAAKTSYKLATNADSLSYAYGVSLLKDLKARGITALNYPAFERAVSDGLTDKKLLLTPEQSKAAITSHLVLKYAANAVAANNYMMANKSKAGVITLPSSLQYMILNPATGPKPKATDTVSVNYIGTVISGKQFDASDPGKPFITALSQVIAGWTEGLQLMSPGAKYRFFIPYQLAYSDKGFDDILLPYSTLIFDVEMLKITPAK